MAALKKRRILFIHQNFPGQFVQLCKHLRSENEIAFLSKKNDNSMQGVRRILYEPHREPSPQTHQYLQPLERATIHGQSVARVLLKMRQRNKPDIIIGHSGWGETLFAKDIFPDVPFLNYSEFFFHFHGADVNFDPEFPPGPDTAFKLRSRNMLALSALDSADRSICPTIWQRDVHPAVYHPTISVLHEGINTDVLRPDPEARLTLPSGVVLTRQDQVVTYLARNIEPYRGSHIMFRAAAEICRRMPKAHVVIVGGDRVSYGNKLPPGENYREMFTKQNQLDLTRVHLVPYLPPDSYRALLQISSAHVYLTVPFVLSWSMLEAMSCGCLLLGSDTAPVKEVIVDGENGLLVDFFDHVGIADRVEHAIRERDSPSIASIRKHARETILKRYDARRVCLPAYENLLAELIEAGRHGR